MSATQPRNIAEIQALQTQTGITTGVPSLHDLRTAFYGGLVSQNDAIRAYLQTQTGLTQIQSLTDLWRQFFIGKGTVNQSSLGDMARDFFVNTGFLTTYINDNFSTDTIANYTQDTGTWAVSGGTLNATVAGGLNWADTHIRNTAVTGLTDFNALCRILKPAGNVQFTFRDSATGGYGLQIRDTSTFRLENYGVTNLAEAISLTWSTGSWYWVRVLAVGTSIKARVWLDGGTEPSTWDIDTVQSLYASGEVGFSVENGTTSFDDLLVTSP